MSAACLRVITCRAPCKQPLSPLQPHAFPQVLAEHLGYLCRLLVQAQRLHQAAAAVRSVRSAAPELNGLQGTLHLSHLASKQGGHSRRKASVGGL